MEYEEFLRSKAESVEDVGFDVDERDIHPLLFDFQRAAVIWALKKGRCALFEDCGLGKGIQQLEWARHVQLRTGGTVLILAPLAVSQQTITEALKLGMVVRYAKVGADVTGPGIWITNYERLTAFLEIIPSLSGVVLDESGILKSYMGKTRLLLTDALRLTPYRLCCTATPAPNDHMELGNHAEFLSVMPANEMLSRWFINDTMSFGTYRLKGHAIGPFWEWVSSWAVCAGTPADLGFPDDRFILPPLNIQQHLVDADVSQGAQTGQLFRQIDLSATSVHREMRLTARARAEVVRDLVNSNREPWIVWCVTPDQRILTDDLRWIPAGDLKEGDGLLSFDEEYRSRDKRGHGLRYWKRSAITSAIRVTRPSVRIRLSDGSEITCSIDHGLLARKESPWTWTAAGDLRLGMELCKAIEPWDSTFSSYDTGYIGGFLDGEGYFGKKGVSANQVKSNGPDGIGILESFDLMLCAFGFDVKRVHSKAGDRPRHKPQETLYIRGGISKNWRLLGLTRPRRLLMQFKDTFNSNRYFFEAKSWPRIVAIESIGDREVVALSTTSRTYISEGFASHNCHTNYEADELTALIPEAIEVRGSELLERKEQKLNAFSTGRERILISKPSICGFGLNWQHCADVAFVGMSYSFESYYQALRRVYRFGQQRTVNAHLVMAETEAPVWEVVRRKAEAHERMQTEMFRAANAISNRGRLSLRSDCGDMPMSLPSWLEAA